MNVINTPTISLHQTPTPSSASAMCRSLYSTPYFHQVKAISLENNASQYVKVTNAGPNTRLYTLNICYSALHGGRLLVAQTDSWK